MIFKKTISKKEFYINFYKSINFILNLSKKELAILAHFTNTLASLPNELTPSQQEAFAFSPASRKFIAGELGISIFNLNNYMKALTDKGVFIKRDNLGKGLTINPKLHIKIPEEGEVYTNEVKFTIQG